MTPEVSHLDCHYNCLMSSSSGPGSSVGIETELRAGRSGDRIPVGARFSARPDQPWGPPSLLYNRYRVVPGGKVGRGVTLSSHPVLVLWSLKSRAITLPTLWATTGPVTGTVYLLPLCLLQLVTGHQLTAFQTDKSERFCLKSEGLSLSIVGSHCCK